MSTLFTLSILQSALELGCIYALVALALFLSFSILNIADLSTDGCFTLGCAVGAVAVSYTHLRAHETTWYLVCRLLLEKNFFNDTATTEIYTCWIVGSVRCV